MITGYFYTLIITPYFGSRAFSPVFVTALLARIGWIPLGPFWLTLDITLLVLFGLSVLEFFATHYTDSEAKEWLAPIEAVVKPSASFLVSSSLVSGDTAAILEHIGSTTSIFAYFWVGITAVGAWYMTIMRNQVMVVLREFDEDDDLGLQQALNWSEEAWVITGVVITFVFPIVAMGMFVMTLLGLFLAKKYAEHLEHKSQVPCPTCSEPIHASAITCSSCRNPNPNPFQVGWLGQSKENQPVTDLNAHRLQLIGRKRCPECATRLKEKSIHQPCPDCFTETFANAEEVEVFLANLNKQLPRIMLISFILGFVPLLGIIPGIIYYRFTLIASLRGYIPRSVGCLTRWGVRIMNLFLISFQPVPPIGFFVLPLMCLINFLIYQGIIKRESNKTFGGGGGYSQREVPVPEP